MQNIASGQAPGQGPRLPDAPVPVPTDGVLALLGRLPVALADLRDQESQAALALASRRGAIKLLLSGGTTFVARARR